MSTTPHPASFPGACPLHGFKHSKHSVGKWLQDNQCSVETLAAFASNMQTHSVGGKHKSAYQFSLSISLSDGSVGSCKTNFRPSTAGRGLTDGHTSETSPSLALSRTSGPLAGLVKTLTMRKKTRWIIQGAVLWCLSATSFARWERPLDFRKLNASWHFPTDMWDDNLIWCIFLQCALCIRVCQCIYVNARRMNV